MMAKVTLNVDLIGGHSLVGPINRLQNALSFNYYANTEMYDPRADSINKSTGQIVDGIKLGEKKKSAGVDLNKLTQSLKSEGIIDQKNDSKTGDNSSTNSKSDITISSDKSNVIVNTKNDTKVKIYITEKGNFKMVTNINQTEDSKTYEVDTSSFKDVDEKINKLKEENESLNSSITTKETSIISGTTTNINKELKELNKDKEKYKKNQEKITILEGESKNNKVKVEAVKTSDEGSLVTKEFTFIDSGLK
jgi:vacuolar-type H+-ATPase subunit H